MISKTAQYLGVFNGTPAVGAKLTFEFTPKGCYNAIFIRCKSSAGLMSDANIAAVLGDVEFTIDGDQKIRETATNLMYFASRKIRGTATGKGIVTIPLYNPSYDLYAERYNFAWATGGVKNITAYLNIIGLDSLTGITFEVFADYDVDDQSALGAHQCYTYQDFTIGGAGSFDTMSINPFGRGTIIQAHILQLIGGSSPTVDNVFVDINGVTLINNMSPNVNDMINKFSLREAPYDTAYAMELIYDGANKPNSAWFMQDNSKIRLRANMGGSTPASTLRVHTWYAKGIA